MTRPLQILLLMFAQSLAPKHVAQLARIKHDMAGMLAKMPDYMCEETVSRYSRARTANDFKLMDTLQLEVAYVGGNELFGKHDAARIDKKHPFGLTGHGVTSNGEFVGHAKSVFANGQPTFHYAGEEGLRGKTALRWDYTISLLASGWTLQYAGRATEVASKGSFWADPARLELLQLDAIATEIEPGFPISASHLSIQYAKAGLGDRIVTLPQRADLLLGHPDGGEDRNVTVFSHCRAYGAESGISFDK